jgi:GH43 family beta-xylosidase
MKTGKMIKRLMIFSFGVIVFLYGGSAVAQQSGTLIKTSDLRIRDPFIYVDHEKGLYYMYAQLDNRLDGRGDSSKPKGVEVYTSTDLKYWAQPETVLLLPDIFWGRNMVWAPEMFKYKSKYYIFATITSDDLIKNPTKPIQANNWPAMLKRGTQIFHADSPLGPFKPFDNKPHTPEEWMALDGTLYVEKNTPYMVFCHEWVQIQDGTMDVIRLKKDLSGTVGKPKLLFKASDAPWADPARITAVTDGPFLHRTKTGSLIMIWSTNGREGYATGQAYSKSGKIKGPWIQIEKPLYEKNGGHGMIFTTLEGKLAMAIHQPNSPGGAERLRLFELNDDGDYLEILGSLFND